MTQVTLDDAIARVQAAAIDDAADRARRPTHAPSLGRIVLVVLENGSIAPGIITGVEGDDIEAELFGVPLTDKGPTAWLPHNPAKVPGSWHWPPRT